ncbi:MAG: hypothetical protein WCG80_15835 [Spirochaetales bacterium]
MKWGIVLFLLVAGVASVSAQTLTLKEKQAIAGLDFSWAENRILENYGRAVKIEVSALTFKGDMDAVDFAVSRGSDPVANAIAKVCYDDLGKAALLEQKVSKVVLVNAPKLKASVTIEKGVLTLTCGFASADNFFSEGELQSAIEDLL